jgi:hypothetical protein
VLEKREIENGCFEDLSGGQKDRTTVSGLQIIEWLRWLDLNGRFRLAALSAQ